MMTFTLVALGSNATHGCTSSQEIINKSLKYLQNNDFRLVKQSRYFRTPAFPPGAGPDFVNAAAVFVTLRNIGTVLLHLHRIEARLGRIRRSRWGQRRIDIDLLGCGNMIAPNRSVWTKWQKMPLQWQSRIAPRELILPHPRLHQRGFVLVPLADIAPNWRHPILGQTVQQMLSNLPETETKDIIALA